MGTHKPNVDGAAQRTQVQALSATVTQLQLGMENFYWIKALTTVGDVARWIFITPNAYVGDTLGNEPAGSTLVQNVMSFFGYTDEARMRGDYGAHVRFLARLADPSHRQSSQAVDDLMHDAEEDLRVRMVGNGITPPQDLRAALQQVLHLIGNRDWAVHPLMARKYTHLSHDLTQTSRAVVNGVLQQHQLDQGGLSMVQAALSLAMTKASHSWPYNFQSRL